MNNFFRICPDCKSKIITYKYKLVDVISDSKILREKYLNGDIKFVDKYKKRFEKYANIK